MAGLREARELLLMAYQENYMDVSFATLIVPKILITLTGTTNHFNWIKWTIQSVGLSFGFISMIFFV